MTEKGSNTMKTGSEAGSVRTAPRALSFPPSSKRPASDARTVCCSCERRPADVLMPLPPDVVLGVPASVFPLCALCASVAYFRASTPLGRDIYEGEWYDEEPPV